MFMFRSRRTNLTRRLLRKKKNEARCKAEEEAENDVQALLKKLQENQLEMLLTAVQSRGADVGNCVLVARRDYAADEPHVLCCRTWRWPDLRQTNELRRLPMCRSAMDPVYICCNPYHWSRLCQPETPPPPYSRTNVDRIRPEDRAPSEVPLLTRDSYGSLTTNGESCMENPLEWCKLAYWELQDRVGPLFPVEPSAVNVFGDVPYGHDGLSLATLAQCNFSSTEPVRKTRSRIGLGVTLSREDDCVWVYNRSDYPIFVNSLCLEDSPDCPQPTRVPAEHCLCVFDPVRAAHQNYGWNFAHPHCGPVDPNSIRISFVKGWGQNYSRREITSCHCWLEILLAPCR